MGAGTRLEQEKDQPEEQALSKCVAIINAKSYYYRSYLTFAGILPSLTIRSNGRIICVNRGMGNGF